MQTTQVYCVERVYEDLRQPFVARDILKQLSSLENTVADIFNRLQHKVGHEKDRIAQVDKRILACQAKVNAISERRTSSKPTTVFSTSKYPAPKVLPPLKSVFGDKPFADTPSLSALDDEEDLHFVPAESVAPTMRGQLMVELLELFENINLFRQAQKAEVDMAKEGLGRLPDDIPSIGSVLLFNSGENPYQKYTSWDNLLGTDYEEEEEMRKQLAGAPKTLVEGDELPSVSGLNYDFHPSMGAVVDLSAKLPTNLPLENIADYKYAADSGAMVSIAPSMFQDKALPDLPHAGNFDNGPSALEPSQNFQVGPMSDLPPPPPPPPPTDSVDFPSRNAGPPPPPPPPAQPDGDDPPPPPMPHESDDAPPPPPPAKTEEEDDLPPPAPEPVDPIQALLNQIRNPNKKLRKVEDSNETKVDAPIASNKPTANKPLSIAEEMKQRMLRRQAAISGKQDQLEQKREKERIQQPVQVLTAQEVTAPPPPPPPPAPSSTNPTSAPPPPPPPLRSQPEKVNRLPVVDMSDDEGSVRGRGGDADDNESLDEENDFLTQIRNLKKKQDEFKSQQPPTKLKPAPPPPVVPKPPEIPSDPIAAFETQMLGMRNRNESLSMSEASDWSDD